MHLLYLDDSGSVGSAQDRHFILAGLAVPEKAPYWISRSLDELAAKLWPDDPDGLEFRGGDIFAGRRRWRGIDKAERFAAYEAALKALATRREARLFGAVVDKAAISPEDPVEYAFEQLCNRFDLYLGRMHRRGDTQRGIIILDESTKETALQGLAREFSGRGHRWGRLRNIAEVPLFVDSRATRLIQMADMVAYALRQYYEKGQDAYFSLISGSFDLVGDVCHGLTHYVDKAGSCSCFCCSRKYWISK